MTTFQIHRLTPVLFLTLTVLFTACNSLTGIDPDEPNAPALEANAALRTAQIQTEPLVREIPEPPRIRYARRNPGPGTAPFQDRTRSSGPA